MSVRGRWIPSELNPSDAASRLFEHLCRDDVIKLARQVAPCPRILPMPPLGGRAPDDVADQRCLGGGAASRASRSAADLRGQVVGELNSRCAVAGSSPPIRELGRVRAQGRVQL